MREEDRVELLRRFEARERPLKRRLAAKLLAARVEVDALTELAMARQTMAGALVVDPVWPELQSSAADGSRTSLLDSWLEREGLSE